jgi:hypothetical protein
LAITNTGFIIRVIIALLITIGAAIYQRMTGPTHPTSGTIRWQNTEVSYTFNRGHDDTSDQSVALTAPDTAISGVLLFKRYKSNEGWKGMKLVRQGEQLVGSLPHQPPAGKLEFFVLIEKNGNSKAVPPDRSVITRFTGKVPDIILILHILIIFAAMLLSNLAGLEAVAGGQQAYRISLWTTLFLLVGGMILGPVVQKFAFNAFWTGVPWGMDLTDNKTLIAMIFWLAAVWRGRKGQNARGWIIAAAIIMLIVFSIPHSVMGSELNYETMEVQTG